MLSRLLRIKSKIPWASRLSKSSCFVLITLALYYSNISGQLPPYPLPPLGFCTSCFYCLVLSSPRQSKDSFPPSIQVSAQCQTLSEGLLWLCYTSPYPSCSVPKPCFIFNIICHNKLYMYWLCPPAGMLERNIIWFPVIYPVPKVGTQKIVIEWIYKGMNEWCSRINQEGSRIENFLIKSYRTGSREGEVLRRTWRRTLGPWTTRQESQEAAPTPPTPSRRRKKGGWGLWGCRWGWVPWGLPVSESSAKWAPSLWQVGQENGIPGIISADRKSRM